jgi:DNA recombination protein RmuC
MFVDIFIGILIGVAVAVGAFFLLKKRFDQASSTDKEAMLVQVKAMLPDIMNQLVKTSEERLKSEKKEIHIDMEAKRAEIERMVKAVKDDLKVNQDRLVNSDKERMGSYKELLAQIEEQRKLTDQLKVSTESLKNVLSNNQMRGQFGEQVAEELLRMAGFVKGQHYDYNVAQQSRDTRPDFTLYLPDKTKINIDVKFPYKNLQAASSTDDEAEKKKYFKLFEQDVKQKIKDVRGREYINPSDNTVDFAIIFIPNEMIFSYIYDKLNSVWTEAMQNKIIFAGPFSFTAILRMVWQAYENFRFQSNIQEIVGNIKEVELEFGKFFEAFVKIGDRINSLDKQFTEVSGTRANVLRKKLEAVKVEQISAPEEQSKFMVKPVGELASEEAAEE